MQIPKTSPQDQVVAVTVVVLFFILFYYYYTPSFSIFFIILVFYFYPKTLTLLRNQSTISYVLLIWSLEKLKHSLIKFLLFNKVRVKKNLIYIQNFKITKDLRRNK
jgi:hypothetical protein